MAPLAKSRRTWLAIWRLIASALLGSVSDNASAKILFKISCTVFSSLGKAFKHIRPIAHTLQRLLNIDRSKRCKDPAGSDCFGTRKGIVPPAGHATAIANDALTKRLLKGKARLFI
jgi:hypothetical protein